jgi:LmbE family N-acetylglucosaminyl deacetylase
MTVSRMKSRAKAAPETAAARTLLAVFAHPDDETFGVGGTLALYARKGVAVHLVCATMGEAGTVAGEKMRGYASIAQLREAELRCAATHLGLTGVHLLGYRDSGMPGSADNRHPNALITAPLEEVTGRITRLIRGLRPQVVLTFDPIGGYRHPDHIAIHRATVEAFQAASDPDRFPDGLPPFQPDRLYLSTFSRPFMRVVVRVLELIGQDVRHFGRNADIDLADIASVSFPVHARVSIRSVAGVKVRASECHSSQMDLTTSRLLGLLSRLGNGAETYIRAFPPPAPGLHERDLFEGLDRPLSTN